MKAITIAVADDLYRLARQKAAAADTSRPQIAESFLSEWARQHSDSGGNDTESRRRAESLKFLDDLAARPPKPGPSGGLLARPESWRFAATVAANGRHQ